MRTIEIPHKASLEYRERLALVYPGCVLVDLPGCDVEPREPPAAVVVVPKPKRTRRRSQAKRAEWRAAVLNRDGMCQRCGSGERLHAHHIKRRHEAPELAFDPTNGLTLCNTCHAYEHEDDFPELARFMRKA